MKLYLATVGEGEKKEVNLHMAIYVPFTKEMMEWAAIHLHKDFYIETVYSNSESKLAFATADETELVDDDTEDGESPEEGEDEPELDPDAQDDIPFETPPPEGKSGPEKLAAYHLNHNTD
jgi:hypothetical protein